MTKERKLDPHIEKMRAAREKVQERIQDRRQQQESRKAHRGWWSETMDRWAEDEHRSR